MMRKINKGVTLVEVLIALAVFTVLMTPLVSSLVSSILSTDDAKLVQNCNDYAESLMENIKNAPVDDLKDDSKVVKYFDGSENVSSAVSDGKGTAGTFGGSDKDFEIKGVTYLGTKHEKYSYVIRAQHIDDTDGYGIMEDLDPHKVAFVPVTFSNYDDVASEAIIAQKISDDDKAIADLKGLRKNTVNRTVKVVVNESNDADGNSLYNVSCSIIYKEKISNKEITYEPYNQTFKNIPNIYLMYNSGVYNGFDTDDEIIYDLSGVHFKEKEKINAFIIRTSEDYSKILDAFRDDKGNLDDAALKSTLSGDLQADLTSGKKLYKESSSRNRNNKIKVSATTNIDKKHFKVYHNLSYKDASGDVQTLVNNGTNIADKIAFIDKAADEVWSRYDIRIWLQKGDKVNTKPELVTLQGTRGGGELELD